MKPFSRLKLFTLMLMITGCTHFGLDSEADVAAENCYVFRYGDKLRRINFAKAFDWCQRSANWGDSNSQALLGELYYLGLGGQIDIPLAIQWYTKAAKQGHAHGQYMLYQIFRHSNTVDQQRAKFWLKQARLSGYKLALETGLAK